jgi:Flp pilus assembly protein TadB
MMLGIGLGCSLGGAMCLLLLTVVPPRPSVSRVVRRWERGRARRVEITVSNEEQTRLLRVAHWGVARLSRWGIALDRLKADVELTDSTLDAHLARTISYGLLGFFIPGALSLTLMSVGLTPSWKLPVVGGLLFGLLLVWVSNLSVKQAADKRRNELRRALSCYVDLVSMSLAGGRGVPEALPAAARIGTGWAFGLLRSTVDRARLVGETPWAALAELGLRIDMPELQDLGGALLLVADDGAKVRASLSARAATMRRRQLAEAEGEAAKADQTIQLAQVVLAFAFFLFLCFPAITAVMQI